MGQQQSIIINQPNEQQSTIIIDTFGQPQHVYASHETFNKHLPEQNRRIRINNQNEQLKRKLEHIEAKIDDLTYEIRSMREKEYRQQITQFAEMKADLFKLK